MLADPSH